MQSEIRWSSRDVTMATKALSSGGVGASNAFFIKLKVIPYMRKEYQELTHEPKRTPCLTESVLLLKSSILKANATGTRKKSKQL